MGTDDSASAAKVTKKKQRDAQRAADNRARAHIARWRSLVKRLRYDRIWMPMWTALMRSRMSPKRDARRKIRAVLWQEWTRPQFGGGESSATSFGVASRGRMSHRDVYILRRARVVMDQAFGPEEAFGPSDFMSEDQMLQAAIEASLISTSAETRDGDHSGATRDLHEGFWG